MCIKYFTARPEHIKNEENEIDEEKLKRHDLRNLILKEYCDVKVYSGYFRKVNKNNNFHHEEKETDVNLAVQVISDFCRYKPKKVIIITNDTDFVPVIKNLLENNENVNSKILLLTPYGFRKIKAVPILIKVASNFRKLEQHFINSNKKFKINKITLQNMKDSMLPDSIQIKNETYLNPYPIKK